MLAVPREQHADASSCGLSRLARQDLDPELSEYSAVHYVHIRRQSALRRVMAYLCAGHGLTDGRMETSHATQNAQVSSQSGMTVDDRAGSCTCLGQRPMKANTFAVGEPLIVGHSDLDIREAGYIIALVDQRRVLYA